MTADPYAVVCLVLLGVLAWFTASVFAAIVWSATYGRMRRAHRGRHVR